MTKIYRMSAPQQLSVYSPFDGSVLAEIACDDQETTGDKITAARDSLAAWCETDVDQRRAFLTFFADKLEAAASGVAEIASLESGKMQSETEGEVANAVSHLRKAASSSNAYIKGRLYNPVGTVGVITSYNFPVSVAFWSAAYALAVGNTIVWKPSEEVPLSALRIKNVFDQAVEGFNQGYSDAGISKDLFQILVGGADVGRALVDSPAVDMISATGSVAMGHSIISSLGKQPRKYAPILELGGNNALVVSALCAPKDYPAIARSIVSSVFPTAGQRCTNTRRLFVAEGIYKDFMPYIEAEFDNYTKGMKHGMKSGELTPLIHGRAFEAFELAKSKALSEGGSARFGDQRSDLGASVHAYYVEPALIQMPTQTEIMFEETFAPVLFVTPYDGSIRSAVDLVNAPSNAGLVNGLFSFDQDEIDYFSAHVQSGHIVINSPRGTGTPANGMGFGGAKDSGRGEVLAPGLGAFLPFTQQGNDAAGAVIIDEAQGCTKTQREDGSVCRVKHYGFEIFEPQSANIA